MYGNIEYVKELYNSMGNRHKLDEQYGVVFVYNSSSKIRDKIHASECIYPEEKNMIISSFRKCAKFVYAFDGEDTFLKEIPRLKQKHLHILVYSMAQDINGIGRRCMIPLACDYYNLINIGAGFMESVYGGNKYLMYHQLKDVPGLSFPATYYILHTEDIDYYTSAGLTGKWLLKPNDESASIGLEVLDLDQYNKESFRIHLLEYRKGFPIFCLQEYIEGEEVAVPLLWLSGQYYCPGISKVVFQTEKHYLDYETVALGLCSYEEYQGEMKEQLIQSSLLVAKILGYKAISRVDFRLRDGVGYIEDIGPNPTISEANGVNELFRLRLNAPSSCVYELLLYSALVHNDLLKPPFHYTP